MPEPATCKECEKVYPSKRLLAQHRRCHEKRYACEHPKCNRKVPSVRFGTKRDLARHNQIHFRSRAKRRCPYCEAELPDSRQDNFKRHIDTNHNGGITKAASKGDEKTVNLYLSGSPELIDEMDGSDKTALGTAITNQQYPVAQLLIQRGADMETRIGPFKETLLTYAVRRQDETIARFLIDKGANVHATGTARSQNIPTSPGAWALHHKMVDLFKRLVQKYINIDKGVLDECMVSAGKGDRDSVKTLLETPEIPKESASRASNAIMVFLYTAKQLDPSWIDLLVELGADVNHKFDGMTILMLAVNIKLRGLFNQAALGVVVRLLKCGADINTKGRNNWTALHAAVSFVPFGWESYRIVHTLLAHGADCQAVTETGETPLDIAISNLQAQRRKSQWLAYTVGKLEQS